MSDKNRRRITRRSRLRARDKRIEVRELDGGEAFGITFTILDKGAVDLTLDDPSYPVKVIRRKGVSETSIHLTRVSAYGLSRALNEFLRFGDDTMYKEKSNG